tara:strand:- start:2141 stop:2557 length:417 start_codon:yes stop_codon:yes gene_type:complete
MIFRLLVSLVIFSFLSITLNSLNASELISFNDNFDRCKFNTNCIIQRWEVKDTEKAFYDLIDILENTPRLKIIEKDNKYVHALVKSRIMKYIDDLEVKFSPEEGTIQIKSASRSGIYDLGVNKRRVETIHFRLIDIYN